MLAQQHFCLKIFARVCLFLNQEVIENICLYRFMYFTLNASKIVCSRKVIGIGVYIGLFSTKNDIYDIRTILTDIYKKYKSNKFPYSF